MPQQVIVIPFSGQLIGQGYNSETGENVGTALEVDSVFEDTATDAQDGTTTFESVETQDSLKESTTIRQLENIGITYERLKRKKAVGVAGGVWFNEAAKPVLEDYFLSVPLQTFQRMVGEEGKKAVVVAGGEEKAEAIRVF
jgi:DNA-binding transcriptional regulator LsrR (DeoR family)